ncbi:MAG: circularly permuted type 2 ATP-grasp protein [Acidobacteriota bacterium]|nr:circularly permuted type 2 ATP-grasp protein [Acidobacteriota bacterium]
MIADLFQTSLADPGVYDELSADGIPRPHWTGLLESLQHTGSEELAKRWARAERRIRENGVTYNVYGDALGENRPWRLDLIPLLIAADEWRFIEAGIIQRAQLLELMLADLYGPQKLVTDGHLPPELLFANPAFLRPVAGTHAPQSSYLHLMAVDLARSPDGQWWVLADRTQAPSGAAYALENRIIVSDVLPDLFRASDVRRLAQFFRAQRDALTSLAACEHPRIVLLTPGPLNETYFEHSYLARYLGFALVEGGDLTVRDRRVYLKTVEGLQQVDVILRRVDDSFCDPLELRGESFLGVPGLVDAVIAGNVKVANALGTGVIETAATMPFLPGLARHLLGERLKLPSVATWWCGQDYALKWVLDHLDNVVVKPAFPSRGMEPVFGAQLARAEKHSFAEQLRARPFEYVAQEQVALSTAPVWDNGRLLPRSMVLRTYVLNTGTGWVAMPGGLVRVAGSEGPVVSMQKGGHSKDAWVLWDGPVDTFSLLPPRDQPVELRHARADLPSRVADNLFWLGRYAERAENIARLLRTSLDRVRRANGAEFDCLIRLHSCFDSRHSKLPKKKAPTAIELEQELISLMSDTKRPDSLALTLDEVHRIGARVRDRLSTDMMRLLSHFTECAKVEEYMLFVEYSAVLSGCLELLSSFSGMERDNITRGSGWLFLSLGRRLERAIYSARQLRELTGSWAQSDWPLLEYLLEVADSSMTYRSRYYTTLQPAAVLDVLMSDQTNPRSLDFQVSHVADLYSKLPRHNTGDLRSMQNAVTLLRSFDLQALDYPLADEADTRISSERSRLKRSLRGLEEFLRSLSNNLSNTYFSHARTLPISIGD